MSRQSGPQCGRVTYVVLMCVEKHNNIAVTEYGTAVDCDANTRRQMKVKGSRVKVTGPWKCSLQKLMSFCFNVFVSILLNCFLTDSLLLPASGRQIKHVEQNIKYKSKEKV